MPEQMPALCPQCGRRPQDCTTTVRLAWEAQEETLCPMCVHRWSKAGPNHVQGRCAGCGRHTDALTEGVCSRCTKTGVSAPTLFAVTPPSHTPGDDPHA